MEVRRGLSQGQPQESHSEQQKADSHTATADGLYSTEVRAHMGKHRGVRMYIYIYIKHIHCLQPQLAQGLTLFDTNTDRIRGI